VLFCALVGLAGACTRSGRGGSAPAPTDSASTPNPIEVVDPACLDREVASLPDTTDVVAPVLRGDSDAVSVVAGTASTNCG
jgi:hypothetical protein